MLVAWISSVPQPFEEKRTMGRANPVVLRRAGVGPHRTVALLKDSDDGVARASLIVDGLGGHLGRATFGASDLADLDLQCKCITSASMTTQGADNGQDG